LLRNQSTSSKAPVTRHIKCYTMYLLRQGNQRWNFK